MTTREIIAELRKLMGPCKCVPLYWQSCPQCNGRLCPVTRPESSLLNDDQFDSIRAGDYYCESCKGSESNTGYKYFWERELKIEKRICVRCASLSHINALEKELEGKREWGVLYVQSNQVAVTSDRYSAIGYSRGSSFETRVVSRSVRKAGPWEEEPNDF